MKRVLFVDHVDRVLGGAEINLIELLESAGRSGVWDSACACHPGGRLNTALAPLGVRHFDYQLGSRLGTLRLAGRAFPWLGAWRAQAALREGSARLAEIIRSFKAEVVVSCTNKDHFAAVRAARRAGIPSVWWVNDSLTADFFSFPARFEFRRRGGAAAALVAVSDHAAGALRQLGLPAEKIHTIHNGIPLERYQPMPRGALRQQLGLAGETPLFAVVGRWTPWKGQRLFLEMAREWINDKKPGHFALIGQAFNEDQPYEQSLRQFVEANRMGGRVHFVRFQESMPAVLSDVDVLLHTSIKAEPFGRVLIEAMALGVPVLAARAGGVPEIITDGETGLLAEPGRVENYLRQLRRLRPLAPELRGLPEAARRAVAERFSLARVEKQFQEILTTIGI